jgi:cystathionine beta-synthase
LAPDRRQNRRFSRNNGYRRDHQRHRKVPQRAKSQIRVVGVDPEGSLYHHEFYGTTKDADIRSYKVEGIGEDFLPTTLNLKIVDEVITVSDKNAFLTA